MNATMVTFRLRDCSVDAPAACPTTAGLADLRFESPAAQEDDPRRCGGVYRWATNEGAEEFSRFLWEIAEDPRYEEVVVREHPASSSGQPARSRGLLAAAAV
jgi:hypothetical protein